MPEDTSQPEPRLISEPILDPVFTSPVVVNRAFRDHLAARGNARRLSLALEREAGCVCRADLDVPADLEPSAETLRYVDRHVKFLVWAHGGWRLVLHGPPALCRYLRAAFAPDGARAFDATLMERIYDHPFTVVEVEDASDVPDEKDAVISLGGHLDGCRVGFDLGASDFKLAAVADGHTVFSTEVPWDPVPQRDPAYHLKHVTDGLKLAASHLPRLDAIGGSAAGVYVGNRVKVASIFRGVSDAAFSKSVTPMFLQIQEAFGVPFALANDGDVTALAGAMSLDKTGILGIAMGSSEAAGYLSPKGALTGYLNELAFAPVDFATDAPLDEWSGDRGVGATYFSQQGVNRLAPAAGFSFPDDMPVPERLKAVQDKADAGDASALSIFDTIGTYLGYTIPHYADYYALENVLILGRVSSGRGGERLMERASYVLQTRFPELAEQVSLHVPDDRMRRVGQAVAAASLPRLQS